MTTDRRGGYYQFFGGPLEGRTKYVNWLNQYGPPPWYETLEYPRKEVSLKDLYNPIEPFYIKHTYRLREWAHGNYCRWYCYEYVPLLKDKQTHKVLLNH